MDAKKQSHLEPIEEEDLNLKEKFSGTVSPEVKKETKLGKENKLETSVDGIPKSQEGSTEKESVYNKILSKASSQKTENEVSGAEKIELDAQVADTKMDTESKVKHLIELAQNKSISYAVKVARHMEDNYVLDELHDKMLGEELYKALLKKGMINKI